MQDAFGLYENHTKKELLKLLKTQAKTISQSTKLESENIKLEQENSYLKFQIEQFKRALFGSKKERFIASETPGQLALPFETDEQQVEDAIEKVVEQISYERTKSSKKKHPGRLALPSHLPVNEIILDPQENIEGLKKIGQEITDELEYSPGKLFINRYIRNKYITPESEEGNHEVKIASLDFRPIAKCIAGPDLLTQIAIDKYIDHLPLYRQLQRYLREGVSIPSSTMESWMKLLSSLLRPLYECHRQHVVTNGYLQADESPIKVQDKNKKGATHTGYMWVYHAPLSKGVIFDYQKGRGGDAPLAILGGFEGYLQTDGYSVYKQFGDKTTITALGCWAHARRYFEKSLDYNKSNASYVILLIQKLYEIERKAKDESLSPEETSKLRMNEALPVLNQIGQYIAVQSKKELPKSPLGKAYNYCLIRWDSLMNYLKDGDLKIDNNLIENAIRPLALGRKNYLFAGSHDAAKDIAMYYSFFATCKKNEINPQKWLQYVIRNINETKISKLKDLLPQFIDKNLLN